MHLRFFDRRYPLHTNFIHLKYVRRFPQYRSTTSCIAPFVPIGTNQTTNNNNNNTRNNKNNKCSHEAYVILQSCSKSMPFVLSSCSVFLRNLLFLSIFSALAHFIFLCCTFCLPPIFSFFLFFTLPHAFETIEESSSFYVCLYLTSPSLHLCIQMHVSVCVPQIRCKQNLQIKWYRLCMVAIIDRCINVVNTFLLHVCQVSFRPGVCRIYTD